MSLLRVMAMFAGLLALAVGLGACIPDERHVDEEKDPHYQRGLKLVNGQDFKGAEEEFEKALETDPHSAAAHFELGCLFDKLGDSAAAIYHYNWHLKLRPDSDQTQVVNERIHRCKQDLANTEFSPPITRSLQREVDRLTAENLGLRQQLAAWQHSAAVPFRGGTPLPLSTGPAAQIRGGTPLPLSTGPAAQIRGGTPLPLSTGPAAPIRGGTPLPLLPLLPVSLAAHAPPAVAAPAASHPRVHVVKQHETISSIAVQHGLKAGALLAANPRVDPRRLRIGQSLALP